MRAAVPPEGNESPALGGAVFFDKARRFAAAGLLLAGLCVVTGSFLDWAVITERELSVDADFGESVDLVETGQAEPFAGVEDRDGKITLAAGVALLIIAGLLVVRGRPGLAWLAFWICVAVGGIAFADYRSLDEANEVIRGIAGRQEVGAEALPGTGLTIVAAGAVLGLISSVGAVAATPRTEPHD
jgi:hypothetical protein